MKTLSRIATYAACFLIAISISACGSSTYFTDLWSPPDVGTIQAKKILMVYVTPDETARRLGEDELVRLVAPKTPSVASYTFLDSEHIKDVDYAKSQVAEREFDVAVVMRMLGTREQTTYVPGRLVAAPYPGYYRSYWGYYSYTWPAVYEPGYSQTTEHIQMETSIFSITQDRLLWVGRSETTDAGSESELVKSVANEAVSILKEQGLVRGK